MVGFYIYFRIGWVVCSTVLVGWNEQCGFLFSETKQIPSYKLGPFGVWGDAKPIFLSSSSSTFFILTFNLKKVRQTEGFHHSLYQEVKLPFCVPFHYSMHLPIKLYCFAIVNCQYDHQEKSILQSNCSVIIDKMTKIGELC